MPHNLTKLTDPLLSPNYHSEDDDDDDDDADGDGNGANVHDPDKINKYIYIHTLSSSSAPSSPPGLGGGGRGRRGGAGGCRVRLAAVYFTLLEPSLRHILPAAVSSTLPNKAKVRVLWRRSLGPS